jgi:hypothetical protein
MNGTAEYGKRYWLSPHVAICGRIEGTVLLDLKRNRYFALSTVDSRALSEIVCNWPASLDEFSLEDAERAESLEQFAESLLQAGLLTSVRPTSSTSNAEAKAPLASIGEEIACVNKTSVPYVPAFIRAYCWAQYCVRWRSLEEISQLVSNMRTTSRELDSQAPKRDVVHLISAFRKLRPLAFTAEGRCLVHSLALLKFLAQFNVFPTWIIGVTLRPWAAHSWIQLRELVLDSTPDKVCDFTPILVV